MDAICLAALFMNLEASSIACWFWPDKTASAACSSRTVSCCASMLILRCNPPARVEIGGERNRAMREKSREGKGGAVRVRGEWSGHWLRDYSVALVIGWRLPFVAPSVCWVGKCLLTLILVLWREHCL
jgi:hypothetical protein